jgi:phage-related protein
VIHWFEYNGKDSRDYGLFIKDKTAFDRPSRNIDLIPIPGRDGNLIIDNGGYQNLNVKYNMRLVVDNITGDEQADFEAFYNRAAVFLNQTADYYKLKDSYNPTFYRKACLTSAIATKQLNPLIADFDVTFSCKPYKYYLSGEEKITVDTPPPETIVNKTNATSLPLFRVYSNYTYNPQVETTHRFYVNGKAYVIKNINNYVDIDSYMMNVFKGSKPKNNNYESLDFPAFKPGNNTVQISSGVSKIEIIPRWRSL